MIGEWERPYINCTHHKHYKCAASPPGAAQRRRRSPSPKSRLRWRHGPGSSHGHKLRRSAMCRWRAVASPARGAAATVLVLSWSSRRHLRHPSELACEAGQRRRTMSRGRVRMIAPLFRSCLYVAKTCYKYGVQPSVFSGPGAHHHLCRLCWQRCSHGTADVGRQLPQVDDSRATFGVDLHARMKVKQH